MLRVCQRFVASEAQHVLNADALVVTATDSQARYTQLAKTATSLEGQFSLLATQLIDASGGRADSTMRS